MLRKIGFGLLVMIALLWARNASLFASLEEADGPLLISHRGVHQTYSREGLTNDTCTAARIYPPAHELLENTIPSMQAAFAYGADVVELDIHLTTDGYFAVFHDWKIDCRTEGTGRTRDHDLAYLKALDLGFGYTADGGESFPLRGKGVSMMPSLREVFEAFPDGRFLVNFKSNDRVDGEELAILLQQNPQWQPLVWGVYGGQRPTAAMAERFPAIRTLTRARLKVCARDYLFLGWSGHVPQICHETVLMVPISHARLAWGWPRAFNARMAGVGTDIVLLGPHGRGDSGTAGLDALEQLERVPPGFDGYLWTNRIEVIGPALRDD